MTAWCRIRFSESRPTSTLTATDIKHFNSTRYADGHPCRPGQERGFVELATAGPGFLVDEEREALGQDLKLPSWLEIHRSEIAAGLAPISTHVDGE